MQHCKASAGLSLHQCKLHIQGQHIAGGVQLLWGAASVLWRQEPAAGTSCTEVFWRVHAAVLSLFHCRRSESEGGFHVMPSICDMYRHCVFERSVACAPDHRGEEEWVFRRCDVPVSAGQYLVQATGCEWIMCSAVQ